MSKKKIGEKVDDVGRDLAPGLNEGAAQIKKGIEIEKDKIEREQIN